MGLRVDGKGLKFDEDEPVVLIYHGSTRKTDIIICSLRKIRRGGKCVEISFYLS